jgi:hypothetical protein
MTTAIRRYITDRDWIDEHYGALADRHDRHYIAVSGGRVIAAAPSIAALKTELRNAALVPPETPTIVYIAKDSDTFLL